MKKLGLLMAASMAATMMGAAAHATVFDFALTTPTDTYSFALNDANETLILFGYDYGPVPVTSSQGVQTEDVGTFLGFNIHSNDFSFSGENFTTETSSNGSFQETFNVGTYSGTNNLENPATLVITDASAVSAAPEPGVWALMLAGVAMIGLTLRQGRRQRKTALAA